MEVRMRESAHTMSGTTSAIFCGCCHFNLGIAFGAVCTNTESSCLGGSCVFARIPAQLDPKPRDGIIPDERSGFRYDCAGGNHNGRRFR